MIARLNALVAELGPTLTHFGAVVAPVVFTWKMVVDKPADATLWAVYMVSVGGCAALSEWIRGRAS